MAAALHRTPIVYDDDWLRGIEVFFELYDTSTRTTINIRSAYGPASLDTNRLRIGAKGRGECCETVSAAQLSTPGAHYDSMLDAFNGGGTDLNVNVLVKDTKTGRMACLYDWNVKDYLQATTVEPGAGIPAASNDVLEVEETEFSSLSHPRFYHPTDVDDDDDSPFSLGCRVGFYMEALAGQEDEDEADKRWQVVGSTQAAKQQPSHNYLEFDTHDATKIGRFIRTLLEYGD
jgi:hypothetical protein